MHVEMFQDIEDVPLDSNSWNSLVERNSTNTVFQTYEWFHSWWKSYKSVFSLVFLVLKDSSNNVTAFAPLMIQQESFGRKYLRFAGDLNADYCDFVIAGDRSLAIKMFLDFLFSKKVSWTSMTLLNIPEYSNTRQCLETICKLNDYKIQIKSPVLAPSLVFDNNFENIKKSLNRYSINRHYNKLIRLGDLEFVNLYKYNDILPYLDDFFEQHIRRYSLKNTRSQFTDNKSRIYFKELLSLLCEKDNIIFSILKL